VSIGRVLSGFEVSGLEFRIDPIARVMSIVTGISVR
jgi:hypothetical protein